MKKIFVDNKGRSLTVNLSKDANKWEIKTCDTGIGKLVTHNSDITCIIELNAFMPIINILAVDSKTYEELFKRKHIDISKKNFSQILSIFRKEFKNIGIKLIITD